MWDVPSNECPHGKIKSKAKEDNSVAIEKWEIHECRNRPANEKNHRQSKVEEHEDVGAFGPCCQ